MHILSYSHPTQGPSRQLNRSKLGALLYGGLFLWGTALCYRFMRYGSCNR
jgi:Zinc finger C-x8-C-x5-C-x3-H type (and similar)